MILRCARLTLRPFEEADRAPFAALNADPEVMRYFPRPLTRDESDAMVDRIRARFEPEGLGLFAVDVTGSGFVGFVGLSRPTFDAPFVPCVEVGWRLARAAWGHGYATEAARAVLSHGFGALRLEDIVSFTSRVNTRSTRVMERLGMARDPSSDFEHPSLPPGHPLRPHVLHRARREAFLGRA